MEKLKAPPPPLGKNQLSRQAPTYNTYSYLKPFKVNLFLCLHFETISSLLLMIEPGAAMMMRSFSVQHKSHLPFPLLSADADATISQDIYMVLGPLATAVSQRRFRHGGFAPRGLRHGGFATCWVRHGGFAPRRLRHGGFAPRRLRHGGFATSNN